MEIEIQGALCQTLWLDLHELLVRQGCCQPQGHVAVGIDIVLYHRLEGILYDDSCGRFVGQNWVERVVAIGTHAGSLCLCQIATGNQDWNESKNEIFFLLFLRIALFLLHKKYFHDFITDLRFHFDFFMEIDCFSNLYFPPNFDFDFILSFVNIYMQ